MSLNYACMHGSVSMVSHHVHTEADQELQLGGQITSWGFGDGAPNGVQLTFSYFRD